MPALVPKAQQFKGMEKASCIQIHRNQCLIQVHYTPQKCTILKKNVKIIIIPGEKKSINI